MISKWLQRLRGGSDSSTTSEPGQPATAPEPSSLPPEPAAPPADPGAAEEPTGNEPA